MRMPDGVGPGKGWDIVINGVDRTFRDLKVTAIEAAQYAKERFPGDLVQIRDCGTGDLITILPDGRIG